MAGRGRAGGGKQGQTQSPGTKGASDWFDVADSHPNGLADWDVKGELLAGVVLSLLALGVGIGFYRSSDGHRLVVRLYDGDNKPSEWVRDSVELEELLLKLQRKAVARLAAGEAVQGSQAENANLIPGYRRPELLKDAQGQ